MLTFDFDAVLYIKREKVLHLFLLERRASFTNSDPSLFLTLFIGPSNSSCLLEEQFSREVFFFLSRVRRVFVSLLIFQRHAQNASFGILTNHSQLFWSRFITFSHSLSFAVTLARFLLCCESSRGPWLL